MGFICSLGFSNPTIFNVSLVLIGGPKKGEILSWVPQEIKNYFIKKLSMKMPFIVIEQLPTLFTIIGEK